MRRPKKKELDLASSNQRPEPEMKVKALLETPSPGKKNAYTLKPDSLWTRVWWNNDNI